jgi:hypothetical protein
MKKIQLFILAGLIATAFTACFKSDTLDPKVSTALDEASTFSDSARTMDFLFRIYSDIGFAFGYRRYTYTSNISAGTAEGCDEAVHRLNGATQPFVPLYNGTLNANDNEPYRWMWQKPYENIRRVNVFMANVNQSPISDNLKQQSKAEARFLRAWYYSILLKNFGGIPIIGDTVYTADQIINPPRNGYEDCVNYIVSECRAAASVLPISYGSQDFGRITKGACLGLISRTLLYAASPLFNGGNMGQTAEQRKVLGYAAEDKNRWQLAAQAAKDIMDMGQYALYEDNTTAPGYGFSRVFLIRRNTEYLLPAMQGPNKTIESFALPTSRGVNPTQTAPSQNLAEAFGMINGKALTDPTSGYNPQNPFVNRDPRFNYTFIFNGTVWYSSTTGTKIPVNIFFTKNSNGTETPASDASLIWLPGYYWRKMMDDNTANNGGNNTDRCLPLIRYAEILLNYAEAANEMGNTSIAYDQLKLIRKRAGIQAGSDGLYGLKSGMTKEEMRAILQNERQVELAWEDHRYWDVRRWKTAPQTQNVDMKAMKIVKDGANTIYSVIPININVRHIFRDPYYFFPIMQSEIAKNPNMIQNPGY